MEEFLYNVYLVVACLSIGVVGGLISFLLHEYIKNPRYHPLFIRRRRSYKRGR